MTTLDLTGSKAIRVANRDAVEVRIADQTAWLRPGSFEDFAGQLYAVYAMKRALKSYNGPCLRVRRNSDNSTLDIGFDKNNWVDVAAITTFVGAGSCYIDTWFDQSGNARHANQTIGSYQPRLVVSGVIETDDNGKPTIFFNNTYFNIVSSLGFTQNADNLTVASNAVSLANTSMAIFTTARSINLSWYRFALLIVQSLGFARVSGSANDADNPPNVNRTNVQNVWQRYIGRGRFIDGTIDITTDGVTTSATLGTNTPTLNSVEANFARIGIGSNGGVPLNGKISCVAISREALNVSTLDRALMENRT